MKIRELFRMKLGRAAGVANFSIAALAFVVMSAAVVATTTTACRRTSTPTPLPLDLHRYERTLMAVHPDSMAAVLPGLANEYALYLEGADLADTLNILQLQTFVQDPWVKDIYQAIEKNFPDEQLLRDLGLLFARAKVLFPNLTVPQVYTYISGMDYPRRVVYADSVLSVSLEMYLPDHEANYRESGFPGYIARRMNPTTLLVEVAQAVAVAQLPLRAVQETNLGLAKSGTLLDEVVYQGKVFCVVDCLLPELSMREKLLYDQEQWQWCENNEAALWHHWMQNQLLYETDINRIKQFINDGPNNLMFQNAPPRLAQYIGWKMVSRYLERCPKDDPELWSRPTQEVLRISGYKP